MDIIDYLITNISPLSWTVKGAGLLLMALLVMRATGQFFSFRWIKAITSLVSVVVVLLILARFGTDIDALIEDQNDRPQNRIENTG